MSELASWLRHDLKTPLAVISGFLELLGDDLDVDSRRDVMRRMNQAAAVLGELVDDVGAWVLVEAGELEYALAAEPVVLDDLDDGFVDQIERSHPAVVVAFDGTLAGRGDAAYLRHALRLVVAAVDVVAARDAGPEVLIHGSGRRLDLTLEGAELGPAELAAVQPGSRPRERGGRMLALAATIVRAQGGSVTAARGRIRIELAAGS